MSGANTVQFKPNICIMNQKSKDKTQGFVFPICSRCKQFKIVFLMWLTTINLICSLMFDIWIIAVVFL